MSITEEMEEVKMKETGEPVEAGETVISDEVVAAIAGVAAREIEGVGSLGKSAVRRALTEHLGGMKDKAKMGVAVEVGKKEAIVDLELGVIYGYNIPSIVRQVRKKVATRLQEISGLITKEINIHVVNIEFPEKKLQAKVE